MRHLPNLILASALALGAAMASAQNTPLPDPRGGISGAWYSPDQSGHGLHIERLDRNRVVLAWYTFEPDGTPLWLVATGRQHGPRITAEAVRTVGGRPPALWDAAAVESVPWGTLTLDFDGCNSGTLAWQSLEPAFGSGSLPIRRLTRIDGLRCAAEHLFERQLTYSFQSDTVGFTALFADLPRNADASYALEAGWAPLPPPLDSRAGFRLSGHNRSDDLAMLVTAPVTGLQPGVLYRVELEVELASEAPAGCIGIGGAPGEGVAVKLGASRDQPRVLPASSAPDAPLRLTIDYGQQSHGGTHARVVGDLATDAACEDGIPAPWQLKTLDTQGQPLNARADAEGRLWVFAGTDSGFEGLSTVYITALRVRLAPLAETQD